MYLDLNFHLFFVIIILTDEGISNDLANYMTMAIDPNVGHIVKFMEEEIPTYAQKLLNLQKELELKLASSRLTLPELFHKVAIRYGKPFKKLDR
jgi:hypothetical protein